MIPTRRNFFYILGASCCILLFFICLSLCFNPTELLFSPSSIFSSPLIAMRLSRIGLAILVGAALAASGSALQALLCNPLADPYALGVSGGAHLSLACTFIFFRFPTTYLLTSFSLLGAFISTVLIVISSFKSRSHETPILVGVAINALSAAIISLLRILLPEQQGNNLYFSFIGALSYPSIKELFTIAVCILLPLCLLIRERGGLDIISLGRDEARRLGIHPQIYPLCIYILCACLIACTVCAVGSIAFVGMVVPQTLKLLLPAEQKFILPLSAIYGAILLLLADILSKLSFFYFSTELPVGIITSVIGVPVFIALLLRK